MKRDKISLFGKMDEGTKIRNEELRSPSKVTIMDLYLMEEFEVLFFFKLYNNKYALLKIIVKLRNG